MEWEGFGTICEVLGRSGRFWDDLVGFGTICEVLGRSPSEGTLLTSKYLAWSGRFWDDLGNRPDG